MEVKFKVDSFLQVSKQLDKLQAVPIGSYFEVDTYYDLNRKDAVLRVRQSRDSKGENMYLTLKIDHSDGEAKSVDETECLVGKDINLILRKLGFKPFVSKKKKRVEYRVGDVNVNLDSVEGLGKFVELEFMGDPNEGVPKLRGVASKLGLDWDKRITKSYLAMMVEKYNR